MTSRLDETIRSYVEILAVYIACSILVMFKCMNVVVQSGRSDITHLVVYLVI